MWQPGDIVMWRGIFNQRVWHAQPVVVVKDTPAELALALLPGAQGVSPEGYANGKRNGKRRWDFKDGPWNLERYTWHSNRVLCLLEPGRYYSTMLFWRAADGEFLCYYMNFQLPFQRRRQAIDTLDLELDLIIHPDLSMEWKDREDYQSGIEHGIISAEWVAEIERAQGEIRDRAAKRAYPLDGAWLDWKPEPTWAAPALPEGWDEV